MTSDTAQGALYPPPDHKPERYPPTRDQLEALLGPIPKEVWEFEPFGHRVVVKQLEADDRTAGGLYIPDTAQQPAAQGWVVKVGPQFGLATYKNEAPIQIPPAELIGSKVLFGAYAGVELESSTPGQRWEGRYLLMQEMDLIGLIQEEDSGGTERGVDSPRS